MRLLQFTSLASLRFLWLSSYLNECGLWTSRCPMSVNVMLNYSGYLYTTDGSLWRLSGRYRVSDVVVMRLRKGPCTRQNGDLRPFPQHERFGAAAPTAAVPAPACLGGVLVWGKTQPTFCSGIFAAKPLLTISLLSEASLRKMELRVKSVYGFFL